MRRRDFIVGLGSAAVSPVVARAQQSLRRVGVLIPGNENDAPGLDLGESGWSNPAPGPRAGLPVPIKFE